MLLPDDMQSIFDSIGQEVLINDIAANVVITNPTISEFEQRYIHSMEKVSRGSIIDLEGNKYLSITESLIKRGGKFKTLIRHCNYTLKIQTNPLREFIGNDPNTGQPVYRTVEEPLLDENGEVMLDQWGDEIWVVVYEDTFYVPAIVDNKNFSIEEGAVRLPHNEMEIIIQDTEHNTVTFELNFEFTVMDKTFTVVNQDKSKNGMIIITCQW